MAATAILETMDQSSGGANISLDGGVDVCDRLLGTELRNTQRVGYSLIEVGRAGVLWARIRLGLRTSGLVFCRIENFTK
jgi:hypothetical protein